MPRHRVQLRGNPIKRGAGRGIADHPIGVHPVPILYQPSCNFGGVPIRIMLKMFAFRHWPRQFVGLAEREQLPIEVNVQDGRQFCPAPF